MKDIRLKLPDDLFRKMKISKAKVEADIEKSLTWEEYFKLIYEDYDN